MSKPFLTINEQVELLKSRDMRVDGSTASILAREGYYSIVNGYKDPFLDRDASQVAHDDRFVDGSSFESMYALFSFDRLLRDHTFCYLIRAEATVRTAVAYCFSDAHREADAYLLQSNYCNLGEYERYGLRPDRYVSELTRLIGCLAEARDKSRMDFIAHYRKNYGSVPLWVLSNGLTFGNLEHFFNLMKPNEKTNVCRMIAESTGRLGKGKLGFFDVSEARVGLDALVRFRNICAHDERLYCAEVRRRKNVSYMGMVRYLERYLTEEEYLAFIKGIANLLDESFNSDPALASVLSSVGYEQLSIFAKNELVDGD